jgi:hypothetical protein
MSYASQPQAPIPHAQYTDPTELVGGRVKKRVIVCCDGWVLDEHSSALVHAFNNGADRTWQDGIVVNERWKYTNILVRALSVDHTLISEVRFTRSDFQGPSIMKTDASKPSYAKTVDKANTRVVTAALPSPRLSFTSLELAASTIYIRSIFKGQQGHLWVTVSCVSFAGP